MSNRLRLKPAALALVFLLGAVVPSVSQAEDGVEAAGAAVGLTLGNVLFLPAKAVAVSMGLISGVASLFFTGNPSLSTQIWSDTLEGPYLITPEVAKKAVGERPELERETSGMDLTLR
jgi:hypothetical protein